MINLNRSTILLTGGTGSFGTAFVESLLSNKQFKGVIRVFSRNESKQFLLRERFNNDSRLRLLIGDIRDSTRILMAMSRVDVVVHAAALRQIMALEYNPFEAVNTNIVGTQHVIRAVLDSGVKRAIFLSSSEACSPANLSGATKLIAEMLFIQSNTYVHKNGKLSVVRFSDSNDNYDSYLSSFKRQAATGMINVPEKKITRFFITQKDGVKFVTEALTRMRGGETFVPKLPSFNLFDLAKSVSSKAAIKMGSPSMDEPLYETLITSGEMKRTLEYSKYFVIKPSFPFWTNTKIAGSPASEVSEYTSSTCGRTLSVKELRKMLVT